MFSYKQPLLKVPSFLGSRNSHSRVV